LTYIKYKLILMCIQKARTTIDYDDFCGWWAWMMCPKFKFGQDDQPFGIGVWSFQIFCWCLCRFTNFTWQGKQVFLCESIIVHMAHFSSIWLWELHTCPYISRPHHSPWQGSLTHWHWKFWSQFFVCKGCW
jgi:hypothetical protein